MASNFPNTEKFIINYANQVEQEIETRLFNSRKIASGHLYDSIRYELKENKARFTLTFKMADYGQFVDKGARPSKYADSTGKGSGKSKFITALQKWCVIKGLPKGAAFPIRRKIWKMGQPATNFFTIPTTRRRRQLEAGIEKNMSIDTEDAIIIDLQKAIRGKKGIKIKGKAKRK